MRRVSKITNHLVAGKFDVNVEKGNRLDVPSLFGNFEGKVALVTGGSIGIGRMIAEGLAVNGARVYITSRKTDACASTAAELNALVAKREKEGQSKWQGGLGGSVIALPGDLSSIEGCVAVAEELAKLESKLHILVNNAGATWGASFDDYPDKAWERVMNLNVRSLFNLTQKCAPLLAAAGEFGDPARVLNISSVGGLVTIGEDGPTAAYAYSASKAAVIHLSKSLARILANRHITTNVICPGLFMTKMNAHLADENIQKGTAAMNPLGRNGLPHDMAGLALFLCSRAGSYVNGAVVPVDGGMTL